MIDRHSFGLDSPETSEQNNRIRTAKKRLNDFLDQGDLLTKGHLRRTSFCVKEIALELFREGKEKDTLSLSYVTVISGAAALHDIGKLSVPIKILAKPKRLSPEEYGIVKTHAEKGAEIIEKLIQEEGRSDDLLSLAAEIARSHHERWDGKGYPKGQKGKEIPLGGRITAVADVFDALVSPRPYKKTYSTDTAFSMVAKESGTHFDPEIVDAFLMAKERIAKYYTQRVTKSEVDFDTSKKQNR